MSTLQAAIDTGLKLRAEKRQKAAEAEREATIKFDRAVEAEYQALVQSNKLYQQVSEAIRDGADSFEFHIAAGKNLYALQKAICRFPGFYAQILPVRNSPRIQVRWSEETPDKKIAAMQKKRDRVRARTVAAGKLLRQHVDTTEVTSEEVSSWFLEGLYSVK